MEDTKESVYKQRWRILVFMGIVIFGNYYAYDSVVPIADNIIRDMSITRAQYGLMFSYYSLPNFIMVLLGGILLDKIGIRRGGTLFAALCVIGIFLTAAGSTFQLMLWGRLLYGIGAESLLIAAVKILSKWFKGKELAFAFGLKITVVRLGNIASINLGVPIQAWSGSWRLALWVSAVIMLVSFAVYLVYTRIDKVKERYFKGKEKEGETDKFVFQDIFKFKLPY